MDFSLEALQKRLLPFFEQCPEVAFAVIFGSVATNRVTPLSDLDIAVFIDRLKICESAYPYGYHANLLSRLMSLLKTNELDIVILNDAPPVLKHRILTQGKTVFCRAPSIQRKIFIQALHRYQDTARLRRIQQIYFQRDLKNLGDAKPHG